MDQFTAMNLTPRGWWFLGVLAYLAGAISASLDGTGLFGVVAMPVLVLAWVGAFLAVDLWVRRGAALD
jgi:hypothetical protein